MKNTSFLAVVLLFCSVANAQTESADKTATPATTTTTPITVPDHLKGVSSDNIRPEHYLPVLGTYQASGNSTANITIAVDEQNVGIVWIDGLPQGRVKGLLKKSPSTYKIPAQKTAQGKSVPEGTLFLDPVTGELSIVLGKAFNDANPTGVFTSETKSKGWKYTGVKTVGTAVQAQAVTQ
jgi:hypothetical protein